MIIMIIRRNQNEPIKSIISMKLLICNIGILAEVVLLMTCLLLHSPLIIKTLLFVALAMTLAVLIYMLLNIYRPIKRLENTLLDVCSNIPDSHKHVISDKNRLDDILGNVMEYQKYAAEKEMRMEFLHKEAELSALQSQVNPHFLFNTLESIRGCAIRNNVYEIADIAEAISNIFRNSLQKVDKLVTLEDELENIKNYMLIQGFRYRNKFDFCINIADEEFILRYKLPNLSIQPLVENAIYHGLEVRTEGGKVTLDVYTASNRLIVRVSDNGNGIEKRTLIELNRKLAAGSEGNRLEEKSDRSGMGIGLLNIHQRIQMQLGEEYGIKIASTVNVGTQVEITLPILLEEK